MVVRWSCVGVGDVFGAGIVDGASTSRLYPPGPLIHPSSSAAALAFRVNRAYVRRLLHFTKYKTILFVRRYLAALIKLSLLSSPMSP